MSLRNRGGSVHTNGLEFAIGMRRSCLSQESLVEASLMRRFNMIPFEGGKLNKPLRGPIPGPLGNLTLQLFPPLYKENFYALYHQPTFWPYCESLERCIVYR